MSYKCQVGWVVPVCILLTFPRPHIRPRWDTHTQKHRDFTGNCLMKELVEVLCSPKGNLQSGSKTNRISLDLLRYITTRDYVWRSVLNDKSRWFFFICLLFILPLCLSRKFSFGASAAYFSMSQHEEISKRLQRGLHPRACRGNPKVTPAWLSPRRALREFTRKSKSGPGVAYFGCRLSCFWSCKSWFWTAGAMFFAIFKKVSKTFGKMEVPIRATFEKHRACTVKNPFWPQ